MRLPISSHTQEWLSPPKTLILGEGEVHVWRGIVDIPSSRLQVFWEVLSEDERQRARRLRFPQHQARFVAARGMLRFLLGHYLNIIPGELEFGTGPHGKPFIGNPAVPPLYFNISHSQKIALFAFSQGSEVGIDVEWSRPRLDHEAIAKRILSSQEQKWLQTLPAGRRKSAFLTCWTRKEAFAKAHGAGLTFPLQNITVTFLPHQSAQLVKIEDPSFNSHMWSMYAVYPRPRYAGALVVEGHPRLVHYWDYDTRTTSVMLEEA